MQSTDSATSDLHLQCMNIESNEVSKNIRNAFGKYMHSAGVHLSTLQAEVFWVVTLFSLASIFTLKLEVTRSSKTMVSYHNDTWCHSPEDLNLKFQCCENLKSFYSCSSKYECMTCIQKDTSLSPRINCPDCVSSLFLSVLPLLLDTHEFFTSIMHHGVVHTYEECQILMSIGCVTYTWWGSDRPPA